MNHRVLPSKPRNWFKTNPAGPYILPGPEDQVFNLSEMMIRTKFSWVNWAICSLTTFFSLSPITCGQNLCPNVYEHSFTYFLRMSKETGLDRPRAIHGLFSNGSPALHSLCPVCYVSNHWWFTGGTREFKVDFFASTQNDSILNWIDLRWSKHLEIEDFIFCSPVLPKMANQPKAPGTAAGCRTQYGNAKTTDHTPCSKVGRKIMGKKWRTLQTQW